MMAAVLNFETAAIKSGATFDPQDTQTEQCRAEQGSVMKV